MPKHLCATAAILSGFVWLAVIAVEPGHTGDEADLILDVGRSGVAARTAEQALARVGSWQFEAVPLSDVVTDLCKRLGFNVYLEYEALNEQGISPDLPITFRMNQVTLDVALQNMLPPMALTYLVNRDVLIITTPAKAIERQVTHVYPVHDLVTEQTPDGERIEDYASLINVIEEATSGPWEVVDGEGGTINEFANSGALVIRQTWAVHREMAGLLAALRKVKRLQQLPAIPVVIPADEPASIPAELESPRGNALEDRAAASTRSESRGPVERWRIPRVDRSQPAGGQGVF